MLDIVAADEHQFAALVDVRIVEDGEARLATASAGADAEAPAANEAEDPGGQPDQHQNGREGDDEGRGEGRVGTEQIGEIVHRDRSHGIPNARPKSAR